MSARAPLTLRLIGTPAVTVEDRAPPSAVLWRKHLALLAYLALSPHKTRSRAHLQALFWPEKDTARARHSLNEAVRRLRAGLGAERVRSEAGSVALDDRALVVDALEGAAEQSDAELLEGLSLASSCGPVTALHPVRVSPPATIASMMSFDILHPL